MKKFWHSLTILFVLYLTPFLVCLNANTKIDKSIKILNSMTSASNDKILSNKDLLKNPTNSLDNNEINNDNDNDLTEFNELTNFLETNLKSKTKTQKTNLETNLTSKAKSQTSLETKAKAKTESKAKSQNSMESKAKAKTNANAKAKSKLKVKQSFDLYIMRKMKMRRKKEIIVKKVFEIFPLLGEMLALSEVEKIHLIINKFFLIRESDLLTKFITMWDTNVNFTHHSAKVLLNLLLCNSRFNKLRCILNLLMEGLCKGDPRSIRIFKEICNTVIIDTILKTNFKYFDDIQAKFNLIRLFNTGFVFTPMTKIQFLEKMLISEKLKEMITFMILRLKSKAEIEIIMDVNLHKPVPPLINYNDTSIKHDERMLPKFIGLRERKVNSFNDYELNYDNIDEIYDMENVLNSEERNRGNSNDEFSERNIDDKDKEELNNINSENDPDSDLENEDDLKQNDNNKNENNNMQSINLNPSGSIKKIYNNNEQYQNQENNYKIMNPPKTNNQINLQEEDSKSLFDSMYKNMRNKITNSTVEANDILKNIKKENDFIEHESNILQDEHQKEDYLNQDDDENINYIETKLINPKDLPYSEKQKIKLSEIKEQIKNEYNQMLYNMTYMPMPELEEYIPHYQVGVSKRTIYPKYKKHIENVLKLNGLLDQFPIYLPRGSIDVSSPRVKSAPVEVKKVVITKKVNGLNLSMQFKEKEKEENKIKEKEKLNKEKENAKKEKTFKNPIESGEFRFKSLMQGKSLNKFKTNICAKLTRENDFASRSFAQLFQGQNPNSYVNQRKFSNILHRAPSQNLISANPSPPTPNNAPQENKENDSNNNNEESNEDVKKKVTEVIQDAPYQMPEIKDVVRGQNKHIKVMFPKEIHSTYQVTRKGTKEVEVNKDNPTKKLIIDRLIPEDQFNDFMNQQEKPTDEIDPTGLYNVLKNIQNRKCSSGFLCIEIGAIYGDFSQLNPRNITVPYNINRNVHFVIKPIVVVNNTVVKNKDIPWSPLHPGDKNGPNPGPRPPHYHEINKTEIDKYFAADDDCDDLRYFGHHHEEAMSKTVNSQGTSPSPGFSRFKETESEMSSARSSSESSMNSESSQYRMKNVNFNNIQRKFYRKVAIAEEIYSQDTFKQGLNMIIIQRDKKYTKLYERTFDTNNNRKESDEMADILKDTPCSKIIVITGIGKWMGAMTPYLVKEIKQIGGPNLNNLFSPDEDDNSMADHSFILIGRRGLCRYNGIFRIKNYDMTSQMQKLFPDLSSDPNDCYFEDVSLENQKNKLGEKSFYHTIDLRLTLNINNDNRFAWDAPTVSTVSPFRGSIHGGQEIKIGGFNFGSHTTDLKEILVGGVFCGDFINLSPNLISCVTRASTIMGPGPKNVIVKLRNGYESPARTCNVYEYCGDSQEALDDLKSTIKTVHKMQNLPIYMNSNYHDQDISIFDHLKFNNRFYKAKLKPDHSNHVAIKLDNLVRANYNELIDVVNNESGLKPKMTGLRRRRFSTLMTKLDNCEK